MAFQLKKSQDPPSQLRNSEAAKIINPTSPVITATTMAGAPHHRPTSPGRRLLRRLTLPSLHSAAESNVMIELLELPPQRTTAHSAEEQQPRRRQTIITTPTQDQDPRRPWPSLTLGSPSRGQTTRTSIDSLRSDASCLSSPSESEPRKAQAARPKPVRPALRKAESEAIWRDVWI